MWLWTARTFLEDFQKLRPRVASESTTFFQPNQRDRLSDDFFEESDKLGLVKEYPQAADANEDAEVLYDVDDGPATTGSSGFASTSLSSPHTS